MFRSFLAGAAAALLAGPAGAVDASHDGVTAAQFATCKAAADQPICLLKLAAQAKIHRPFRENIAIGYAPAVLAAIGPDPADDLDDPVRRILHEPYRAAAVQALIADHAGESPAQALAPIRAMPVRKTSSAADEPRMVSDAAELRIMAYEEIWRAAHGDAALPSAHRPSAALIRAVLDAWRADLPKAGDHADAGDLAEAYQAIGDTASAAAVAPQTPADQMRRLLADGRYADAAEALERMRTEPSAPSPLEAKTMATMNSFFLGLAEAEIIRKAVDGGRADVAVAIAEKALNRWLSAPAPAGPGSGPAMGDALQVAADLMLIVEKAPRTEALKWTQRVDGAARDKSSPAAAVNALAAMRAWTKLGDTPRAKAIMARWAADVQEALDACKPSTPKTCLQHPAMVIAVGFKAQPIDTAWDELAPAADRGTGPSTLVAAGRAGIDAKLASLQDPWQRMLPLFHCETEAVEAKDLSLAAYCAHRLAVEPAAAPKAVLPGMPPLRPERIGSFLRVARAAAQQGDRKVFADMVALAFDLAARDPEEYVGAGPTLEDIAIAELREQGRL